MGKIILRTICGIILGYIIYQWTQSSSSVDYPSLVLFAWGIGFANAFSFNLNLLGKAFSWATNLGILSFLSFGSGMLGLIALVFMLGVVLAFGWLYGWYVLIRDIINEIR